MDAADREFWLEIAALRRRIAELERDLEMGADQCLAG